MINGAVAISVPSPQEQSYELTLNCINTKNTPHFTKHLIELSNFIRRNDISALNFNSIFEQIMELQQTELGRIFYPAFDKILKDHWNKINWNEKIFKKFQELALKKFDHIALKYYPQIVQLPNIPWKTAIMPFMEVFFNFTTIKYNKPTQLAMLNHACSNDDINWCEAINSFPYNSAPFWKLVNIALFFDEEISVVAQNKILSILKTHKKYQLNTSQLFQECGDDIVWILISFIAKPHDPLILEVSSQLLSFIIEKNKVNIWKIKPQHRDESPFELLLKHAENNDAVFQALKKLVFFKNGLWEKKHLLVLLTRCSNDAKWLPLLEDLVLSNSNPKWDFNPQIPLLSTPYITPAVMQKYQAFVVNANKALKNTTKIEYEARVITLNLSESTPMQDEFYQDGVDFSAMPNVIRSLIFTYQPDLKNLPITSNQYEEIFTRNYREVCKV